MIVKKECVKPMNVNKSMVMLAIAIMLTGCSGTTGNKEDKEVSSESETMQIIVQDEINETNFTSETKVSLKKEEILSVIVDDHYGTGDTDARFISIAKNVNGGYIKSAVDYKSMESVQTEISKESFDKAAEAAASLSTIRTYQNAPSEIWMYATIELEDGTRYFFNDQKEVKEFLETISDLQ